MRYAVLAVAVSLLLAGCGAPVASPGGAADADRGNHPDPATDRLGWENGYWYNDSVAITPEDGLNATERDRLVSRSMARVERLRGLEFEADVDVSVIGRSNFSSGGGNASEALRAFDNAKFEALFLVGNEEDSIETQGENRNQTVAGYYSPNRGDIVVVSDSQTPEFDSERTLAHELVHALQDQHFDLTEPTARTRDAYNARNGLVEGDARTVELSYMDRCGTEWSCLSGTESEDDGGSGGEDESDSGSLNLGIYILSYFPYSDGPDFVDHRRDVGGWDAVDAVFDDRPSTARVVINPEEYGEFEPREVELSDRTGDGWERVRPPNRPDYGTLGQSALTAMFAYTLYDEYDDRAVVEPTAFLNVDGTTINQSDPFNYDIPPARGWTGDRLHVYERGGERGYVWRLTWESSAAAERFADHYRTLLSHWGGQSVESGVWRIEPESPFAGAVSLSIEGESVTIVGAPTRSALDGVRQGSG